jgi:isopenicillin N synthase-like dioxygenase
MDGVNRWPDAHPWFRETMMEFYTCMERAAFKLLEVCRVTMVQVSDQCHTSVM